MEDQGTGPLDDAYLRLKARRGNLEDVRLLVGEGLLAPVRRYGEHVRNSTDALRLTLREPPWCAMSDDVWQDVCQSGDIGRLLDLPIDVI